MKVRKSFVTNSSSSSFLITNISGETHKLEDFFTEMKELIEEDYIERVGLYEPDENDKGENTFLLQYPTVEDYMKDVINDAKKLCDTEIAPLEKIERECSDHASDSLAEYIINMYRFSLYRSELFDIEELESHH